MRILIVYFTMSGRTKKMAEAIASSLTSHEVNFTRFELMGKISEKFKIRAKLDKGDYSMIQSELDSLASRVFDLLIIGMPTYGNLPPSVFKKIVEVLGNLTGKNAVVFNTARMTGNLALNKMEEKVNNAGATIIEKKRFRGFFRLGTRDATEFGRTINQQV